MELEEFYWVISTSRTFYDFYWKIFNILEATCYYSEKNLIKKKKKRRKNYNNISKIYRWIFKAIINQCLIGFNCLINYWLIH